jgi:hypothetical protein
MVVLGGGCRGMHVVPDCDYKYHVGVTWDTTTGYWCRVVGKGEEKWWFSGKKIREQTRRLQNPWTVKIFSFGEDIPYDCKTRDTGFGRFQSQGRMGTDGATGRLRYVDGQ